MRCCIIEELRMRNVWIDRKPIKNKKTKLVKLVPLKVFIEKTNTFLCFFYVIFLESEILIA